MAKKLENLLWSYRVAFTDAERYPLDESRKVALRNVENNIKGAFGDAHKMIAAQKAEILSLRVKLADLLPPAPTIEYVPFDAATVKPGDTVEVRDVTRHGIAQPWRVTTFVCVAPRTGLVITETEMQANAHQTENVRITKRSREVQLFAHVFDMNGDVAGTVSSIPVSAPTVPEGARHIGNNVPVTITVAE